MDWKLHKSTQENPVYEHISDHRHRSGFDRAGRLSVGAVPATTEQEVTVALWTGVPSGCPPVRQRIARAGGTGRPRAPHGENSCSLSFPRRPPAIRDRVADDSA